ncbi:MAG: branched-chain amino acid ABC transporter permease [Polyangiaceae bacterium]
MLEALKTGIVQGAMIALISLGYSMVYGILKLINFAHSEVFMMGAYFGLYLIGALIAPTSPVVAIVLGTMGAMLLAGTLGALVERSAYAPLRHRSKGAKDAATRIAPLVTALGMSVLLTNLAQLLFGASPKPYPPEVKTGGYEIPILVASFGTMAGLYLLIQKTWFGKAMRALSMNTEAARLMGINTSRVISLTFMTGSALAALGAVLYCLDQSLTSPTMGAVIGTRAFVAAVIGGIGNIPGALLGGLLIGVLGELTKTTKYAVLQDPIVFSCLILVLLVKPAGLLGKDRIEKV